MSNTFPPQGQMVLYSSATPPLEDGSYQLTVTTNVGWDPSRDEAGPAPDPLTQQHYFDVVGPRFSLPPQLVAGCFPPRNAHGAFEDALPHIVIGRRTLPWERKLAPEASIPVTPRGPHDAPAIDEPVPWVALLLFQEGEYTLLRNIPLEQAVPASVFAALGKPANITCDAVEAEETLVKSIMPTYEELKLLVHVRQVNTDDRELNAYGGDGFFSVVVGNRLPAPNAQCRVVLVSLEQRTDLIPKDNEVSVATNVGLLGGVKIAGIANELASGIAGAVVAPTPPHDIAATQQPAITPALRAGTASAPFQLSNAPARTFNVGNLTRPGFVFSRRVRLVALASWQFTCEGPGTFRELMQGLSDAMFGTLVQTGQPPLTDTGHLTLSLQDRAGTQSDVLYRGPLVQYQLTRDPLGPYHSADQARRVAPESGTEDVSYAAAFEVGRLLAAADARLAQSLMRWRRESYKQSARASTISAAAARVQLNLPASLAEQLHTPISPRAAAAATVAVSVARPVPGDPYGLGRVASLPGLDAAQLAGAWQLTSAGAARALLGGDPGTLGAVVATPVQTVRVNTNIDTVAADAASLARLTAARAQTLANAAAFLGDA
jgi:hypothetical protein